MDVTADRLGGFACVMDVGPTENASRPGPGQAEAALEDVVEALQPDWLLLRNCWLPGGPRGAATDGANILLHAGLGIALLDILPADTPDGVARIRRRLEALRFGLVFPGWLPIVHLRLRMEDLPRLEGALENAFAREPRIMLPGGAAWIGWVRRALTTDAPKRIAPRRQLPPPSQPLLPPMPLSVPRRRPRPEKRRGASRMSRGLRALLVFWGCLVLVLSGGAAVLQYLGPIEPPATLENSADVARLPPAPDVSPRR